MSFEKIIICIWVMTIGIVEVAKKMITMVT